MYKRLSIFIFSLVLMGFAFATTVNSVHADADADATTVADAISLLHDFNLSEVIDPGTPVFPLLIWDHLPAASWYRIYMQGVNTGVVYDVWYEALVVCSGGCELDSASFLPEWGLVNDDYQWWIAAYVEATGEIIWSGGETFEPATFTVDIAVPALPTVSAYWGDLMPEMIVSLEPDTLWFQLYVGGNGEQYLAWHSINDPACDEFYNCRFEAENYLPLYWGPGEYAVWVQGWGPGGFSSPDGSDSVASWVSNSYGPGLVFPSEAPLSLENGDLSANSNDANIDLAWEPAENGTWQQVIVETDEGVVYYSQWHHVGDLGCSSGGSCGLVLENVPQGGYVIRIGSWGPGGFSTGGPNGDGYGVTEHSHSYISVA